LNKKRCWQVNKINQSKWKNSQVSRSGENALSHHPGLRSSNQFYLTSWRYIL